MRYRSYAFPDSASDVLCAKIIMTNLRPGNTGSSTWHIDGDMTIYRAPELKNALMNLLAGSHTLDIDLSGVTELDCAGVQLLMLAKHSAQEKHCVLRLLAHSPVVLDVFGQLNLTDYFSDLLILPADQPDRGPITGYADER